MFNFLTLPIQGSARDDLAAAQFMLGSDYIDWAWRERMKANPVRTISLGAWPYRRLEHTNVVKIKGRK